MDSSNATVDPGPGGFLGIFGGNADAAPESAPETDTDTAAQAETTAADQPSPGGSDDRDLSAEDVVAARFAASLADDGIEVPAPESTEAEPKEGEADHLLLAPAEGEISFESLTEEQKRALVEEAIRLRGEVSTTSQQEALRKVQAAEYAAIAQVQAEYEQNVLSDSGVHYGSVFKERFKKVLEAVTEEQLPDHAVGLFEQFYQARRQYEDQQAETYEQKAHQARINARLTSPDFRQFAAERLVAAAGLPKEAVAIVLETRDTRDFEKEVKRLVETRDSLAAIQKRNQDQLRAEGNKRLRETAPRTAATGRPPGGKPPDYKGTAAEGARLLSIMRS